MSRLTDLIQNGPVHRRKIEIQTYPAKEDQIIVEGLLEDKQMVHGYRWDGQPRSPGIVHHMCARLLVGDWPLTILDAEAEMTSVPHDLCPTTLDTVNRLIGLQIVSGYSEKIRDLIGGTQSCAHLVHLLTVMGPAALQGYWTHLCRNPRPFPTSLEEVSNLNAVINTCRLWREDGPLVQHIKEALQKKRGKSG
jgi:hypothetical protein